MATVTFAEIFNLVLTTKQFQSTDITDYDGQGLGANDMFGTFLIVANSGNGEVVYDGGTPSPSNYDIRCATSRDSVRTMPLPLTNGVPTNDRYKITYTVWDDANEVYYTTVEYFNFVYASPTVDISGKVDVNTPLLTEYDNTIYMVNSVAPTLDRTCTITYPPVLINGVVSTIDPTVGTTAITTSNYFFAPTEVAMSVETGLSFDFPASGANTAFTVLDFVDGVIQFPIPASNLCKYYCGLKQYWINNVLPNPTDADLKETYSYLGTLLLSAEGLLSCGDGANASILLSTMLSVPGFSNCCKKCNDSVQQVVGIGGLVNAYNVLSSNGYITVSPVTSGNTTTFTLTLSQTFIDLVTAQGADIAALQVAVADLQTAVSLLYNTTITSVDDSIHWEATGTNPKNYDLRVQLFREQTQKTSLTLSDVETQIPELTITPENLGGYLVLVDVQGDQETGDGVSFFYITLNGTHVDSNNAGIVNVSATSTPATCSFSNFVTSADVNDEIGVKAYSSVSGTYTCNITMKIIKIR